MDIKGKTALVTGAGSGIGRASAIALAQRGAKAVALADLHQLDIDETGRLVEQAGAQPIKGIVDVTDAEQQSRFMEYVADSGDGIDIVHNNAGTICGEPIWPETRLEKITQVVSVNLLGVLYGNRIAVELLAKNGGGVVINTASTAALGPMPAEPVYAATKAAVVNLTHSCAGLAESHNVRVNAVLPGMVKTSFIELTGDGTSPAAWLQPVLAHAHLLTPEQIAEGVIQLIENDSASGSCLVIENPAAQDEPPATTLLPDAASYYQFLAAR